MVATVRVRQKNESGLFSADCRSLRRAVRELAEVRELADVLSIFAHFFPDEFSQHEPCGLRDFQRLNRLCMSMCRLIDERLFPVPWWVEDHIYELADGELGLPSTIPLAALNGDYWDYEPRELMPVYRAILVATGESNEAGERIERPLAPGLRLDTDRLARLCRKGPPALRSLPAAVKCLYHDTGNPFLDITSEDDPLSSDRWTIENVKGWQRLYAEAREVINKVEKLSAWVGKSKPRFNRVVGLVRAVTESEVMNVEN